jgi:hypothetical protein
MKKTTKKTNGHESGSAFFDPIQETKEQEIDVLFIALLNVMSEAESFPIVINHKTKKSKGGK